MGGIRSKCDPPTSSIETKIYKLNHDNVGTIKACNCNTTLLILSTITTKTAMRISMTICKRHWSERKLEISKWPILRNRGSWRYRLIVAQLERFPRRSRFAVAAVLMLFLGLQIGSDRERMENPSCYFMWRRISINGSLTLQIGTVFSSIGRGRFF